MAFVPFPLPNPFSEGIAEVGQQFNKLREGRLENEIRNIQAQYAPLTTQAEAASKLAYANLMGPQFLAKLMGNKDILANIPNPQNALQHVYNASMGQGTGMNMLNQSGLQLQLPPRSNSLLDILVDKAKGLFGQPTTNPQQNAMNQLPQSTSMLSGGIPLPSGYSTPPLSDERAPPSMVADIAEHGNAKYGGTPLPPSSNDRFFERSGRAQGITEEGKELGKIRGHAIEDLDTQYQQAVQAEVPVNHLIEMTQSPEFMQMRNQIPFFQDKQLNVLSKIGTPEQQKLIGDFVTTTQNAVANTIMGFRGRILDKEVTIANNMKINPNDTWNVMLGKLSSIATFNEMTKQRSRIASELMQKEHISRGEALERADKQVDANKIRKSVESKLNPKPSDEDIKYMAQKYNITPIEVKKRLNKKGYKLEVQLSGEE